MEWWASVLTDHEALTLLAVLVQQHLVQDPRLHGLDARQVDEARLCGLRHLLRGVERLRHELGELLDRDPQRIEARAAGAGRVRGQQEQQHRSAERWHACTGETK
jgi:hypothetical protein